MEKQTRVLNISTEQSLGKFSVTHKAFPWLVLHAADVLTKLKVRPDGLTAYEAIKGREFSGVMLEFGSVVLFKASAKVSGSIMEPRWRRGIWLGKRLGTEEHVVGTPDGGAIRSCAVKPHPEQQWDTELFDNLRGVPWDPSGKAVAGEAAPEHTADLPKCSVARSVEPTIPQARRVLISRPTWSASTSQTGVPSVTL